jgi:hypothetical protein
MAAPGEAGTPRAAGGGAVIRTGGWRDRCAARRDLGRGIIEVALGGAIVRVPPEVDGKLLGKVLRAVKSVT